MKFNYISDKPEIMNDYICSLWRGTSILATSRKWEINHDNKFDCWFLFDCTLKHFIYDWVFLIKWSMGLGMINYILKIKKDATRMITVELSALVVFIFSFSSNLDIIMDNNRYHKNNSYFLFKFWRTKSNLQFMWV